MLDHPHQHLTHAEATRAIKATLRKAAPSTRFTVSTRGWQTVRWTDDGPTVEQVQATLIAAGCGKLEDGWHGGPCFRWRGNRLSFDRYNAAARTAEHAAHARRAEEDEQRPKRENEVLRTAERAKSERENKSAQPWLPAAQDAAQQEKACAAFEELRQRAERDVASEAEQARRPSWAPPLIIEGELLEVCIALGLLTADDKPIARLWAVFANPRKPGLVLREHNVAHGQPDIACRGFQLHAGGERGPTSDILFEAQRQAAGTWQFGPWRFHYDYRIPRHREWERLVCDRVHSREHSPERVPGLDALIAAIDARDLVAAQAHNKRAQLRDRAVELGRDRVLDFAGAPGLQMRLAGRLSGNCFNCWRELTDPQSLEYGIGPDCLEHRIRYIRYLAAEGDDVPTVACRSGMSDDFVVAILAADAP